MSDLTVQQIKSKRMVFLVLSTITLLFLGLIYAFSMFAAPMCEFFGLERSQIGLTFNIMMIMFCLGCVGGSIVDKKLGVKGALVIAALMFAIGFIGTAFLAHGNIIIVYVFYGIIAGIGVGIGYNTLVATTNVWFPDRVGFSSGIMMMGFGIGSLIFGTLGVKLYGGGMALSTVFTIIGCVGGIIAIITALFLRRPPKDIVQVMAPEKVTGSGYDPADEDKPLKTPLFWVYWVWAIIVIGIGLATIGNCASDAQLVGWDSGFATLLVGLVSTCNGLSRVIFGLVYDKTNVKVTMLVGGVVALAATLCIALALNAGIAVIYVVGALLCGFCYGGVPVVASAFARTRFGAKNYPFNLSVVNFAIVFGSLLNLVIQAACGADARSAIFIVLVVLAAVAVLDCIPFSKMFNKGMKVLEERRAAHEGQAATTE